MYSETLLVFIKDRNIVTEEAEKEGVFPEVMIDVVLVGKYLGSRNS